MLFRISYFGQRLNTLGGMSHHLLRQAQRIPDFPYIARKVDGQAYGSTSPPQMHSNILSNGSIISIMFAGRSAAESIISIYIAGRSATETIVSDNFARCSSTELIVSINYVGRSAAEKNISRNNLGRSAAKIYVPIMGVSISKTEMDSPVYADADRKMAHQGGMMEIKGGSWS